MLFMTSLVCLPFSYAVGFACDRAHGKVWLISLGFAAGTLAFLLLLYSTSENMLGSLLEAGIIGSHWQSWGFMGSCFTASMGLLANQVLLSKAIQKSNQAYGCLKGLSCTVTTSAIIVVDFWGGNLSAKSAPAPFLICAGALAIQCVMTLVMGMCGWLKI